MQTTGKTFGTLVTCIDGRVQHPASEWVRERFDLDYVDVITEPGPDKLMAEGWPGELAPVRKKLGISIDAHASRVVALCGHDDCAANRVTTDEHRAQITAGVRLLRSWNLGVEVVGLWLNERREIEVVDPPLGK